MKPLTPPTLPFLAGLALPLTASCEPGDKTADREALMDPDTCEECHPEHTRQWRASMHAYASDDPYFRAMNAMGQEDTNGALGDFCLGCHAPVALAVGATTDGLNLDELPRHLRGITCYYCHTVDAVLDDHNNGLRWADDLLMRGPLQDPSGESVHDSAYSPHHDGATTQSSDACGSCHDVITPSGVPLERTYKEWTESFFSDLDEFGGRPAYYAQQCTNCHMPGEDGPIADAEGVRADRRRHDHTMPGFGVFVDNFPSDELGPQLREEQRRAMEAFRRPAICATVCVDPIAPGKSDVTLWLHNEASGHSWPTGAAQDRRAWVQMSIDAAGDTLLETGSLAAEDAVAQRAKDDPNLWWFGDTVFDGDDNEVHAHWKVEKYTSRNLPIPDTVGGDASTWLSRTYTVDSDAVDHVSVRMYLRAMPRDLLDELVEGGWLQPELREALPTFEVEAARLNWTPEDALTTTTQATCVASSKTCRVPGLWED